MEFVAVKGLLFAGAAPEARLVGGPLARSTGYQVEAHDRDGQAIAEALVIGGQVETAQDDLPHVIDGPG
jgi:hypothetical protein